MTLSEEISEIEGRCAAARLSVAEFLRRADVHPTMWSRYKVGASSPNRRTWDRIQNAAGDLPQITEAA